MTAQDAMMREIGEALRELRVKRGLTLRELAALTDGTLTAQGINRIELGQRSPNARTLAELARALNVAWQIGPTGARMMLG